MSGPFGPVPSDCRPGRPWRNTHGTAVVRPALHLIQMLRPTVATGQT
jgi:hypothetical protein